MKRQKEHNTPEIFLTKLQANRDFRESVFDASSPAEMRDVLGSYGFDLDLCQLIKAVAEFMDNESEEITGWSCSFSDKSLLELL